MILDGSKTAEKIKEKIRNELLTSKQKPGLAAVIVGDNHASKIYVAKKQKGCAEIGIYSEKFELNQNTTTEELLILIEKLNNDEKIHGILVQLPLPEQINEDAILSAIKVEKDVDGFSAHNMGRLLMNNEAVNAATPMGIIRLMEEYNIEIAGKNAVIIGRSRIVGRPVGILLLNRDATVTYCHSKTKNLAEFTKKADIIVVAVGKSRILTADMVKEGATVIDVGMNKEDGSVVGDVDFEKVREVAGNITPVPGGVGPMTIAMLLENTYQAFKKQNGI